MTKVIAKKKSKKAKKTTNKSPTPSPNTSALLTKKQISKSKSNQLTINKFRAQLKSFSTTELGNVLVSDINQLVVVLNELDSRSEKPVSITLGNYEYPMAISGTYYSYKGYTGTYVCIEPNIAVFDLNFPKYFTLFDSDFKDSFGQITTKTVSSILAKLNMKIVDPAILDEYKLLLVEAQKYRDNTGLVLDIINSVLIRNKFFFGNPLVQIPLGSEQYPRTVVIEPSLELDDNKVAAEEMFPLLRAFSFDTKEYVFVDVRDIRQHNFHPEGVSKLILPTELKEIVSSVFTTKDRDVFGDVFIGRHGGMVVLANGSPGIGKTLSAEVFAEATKRPLYVLEMGELGTNLETVELALQRIFARAARWNTVLLFDEADIFLAKRTENDLERNAIVGVFLRLLDSYRGFLFLTTNRADSIDTAFASRITLRLDFPDLTPAIRFQIWQNNLIAAGLNISGDLEEITHYEINGRQIRNTVRLLKATHPGNLISTADITKYLKYSPTLQQTKGLTNEIPHSPTTITNRFSN